jgi:hypothetical protein
MKAGTVWMDHCAPNPRAVAYAQIIMRPFMRTLLRLGLSAPQVGMIGQEMAVEAAGDLIGASGRKVRAADVAAISGIKRGKIRTKEKTRFSLNDRHLVRPASEVIAVWRCNAKYLDARGLPAVLPMRGRISFASLVREHGRDVTPKALLRDLLSNGAARLLRADSVRLIAESLTPDMPPEEELTKLARKACAVLEQADRRIAKARIRKSSGTAGRSQE